VLIMIPLIASFMFSILFKYNQHYIELLFMFYSFEDSKIYTKKLKIIIKHADFFASKLLICKFAH